jgi:hypothetical protein
VSRETCRALDLWAGRAGFKGSTVGRGPLLAAAVRLSRGSLGGKTT